MTGLIGRVALAVFALFFAAASSAGVAIPELRAAVTDLTDTLDEPARAALESRLTAFQQQNGAQIAVLIVPSTQPETIEQYSIRVVDAWKLGRAEQDDGVLLLIAMNDRTMRIEIGKGLEGVIPDALAKRIIDETIVPAFRKQDVSGGIAAGVDQILGLVRGEPLPEPQARDEGRSPDDASLGSGLFFGLLVVGQLLRTFLGRLVGATAAAVGTLLVGGLLFGWIVGLLAMVVMFVVVLVADGRGGGSIGSYGGRSGGGFSSRGGFSGGGGGFSGGGASGRW